MASSYQRLLSWLGSRDSLQPEAPPERRRVAGQAPALSPQQPPRQRAGCERIAAEARKDVSNGMEDEHRRHGQATGHQVGT